MEFKDKIMLNCFREVKCKQGFTTDLRPNVLGLTVRMYISGLMDSKSEKVLQSRIVSREARL